MQESEKRLSILFEQASDAIFVSTLDGRLVHVNGQALQSTGYSREELLGLSVMDVDAETTTPNALSALFSDMPQGEPVSFRSKHQRKDGTIFPVEVTAAKLEIPCGFNIIRIARDITARMQAEKEREDLVKKLKFKNKELQDIVYIASHDLKSPLVNIEGFSNILEADCGNLSDLLAMQIKGDDKSDQIETLLQEGIPQSLGFITRSTKKMASLLDGLLHVSRVGAVEISTESLDMDRIAHEVVGAMEHQISKSKAVVTVEPLPRCIGDAQMMDHVLTNLVGNAVKYLDPTRKGEIRISGKVEDRMSVYCVEDNGIGIATDHQGKIFEIFHRLAPEGSTDGEGLGLTIVTRIIDLLSGEIWVESEAGEGSKFFFSQPFV